MSFFKRKNYKIQQTPADSHILNILYKLKWRAFKKPKDKSVEKPLYKQFNPELFGIPLINKKYDVVLHHIEKQPTTLIPITLVAYQKFIGGATERITIKNDGRVVVEVSSTKLPEKTKQIIKLMDKKMKSLPAELGLNNLKIVPYRKFLRRQIIK